MVAQQYQMGPHLSADIKDCQLHKIVQMHLDQYNRCISEEFLRM